jgi:hypothetical protein
MNRRFALLSCAAALCVSVMAGATGAQAATSHVMVPPPPAGWTDYGPVTLSVEASHKCLDADTTGGGVNGNKVQIWDCNNMNQQWWWVYKSNATGAYAFVNGKYSKCLDQDTNTYARNGGKVQLWDCNFYSQQQWIFDPPPAPFPSTTSWYLLRMQGAHSYCVDADSTHGYANGTKVQVWFCNGNDNQKWHSWPAG